MDTFAGSSNGGTLNIQSELSLERAWGTLNLNIESLDEREAIKGGAPRIRIDPRRRRPGRYVRMTHRPPVFSPADSLHARALAYWQGRDPRTVLMELHWPSYALSLR